MRFVSITLLTITTLTVVSSSYGADWQVGFARVDVTPQEPVRMAGYGNRDHPSQGIDTPLHARAMALRDGESESRVLVSVDTIGLDAGLAKQIAEYANTKHGLSRDRIVLCSTHTHCAPDLDSNLDNIFTTPLTAEEKLAAAKYRQQLLAGVQQSIDQSLASMLPSVIAHAQGTVGFAGNRRVLKAGRWTGFGLQADGPVDHSVPVLRISDLNGKVRGIVFNYACHCTTLGGNYYRINAEWAGYATTNIESSLEGTVALCTIGCGADANPNPRDSLELAQLHGREMSQAVLEIARGEMKAIDTHLESAFDYTGLAFDLPTIEELRTRAEDSNAQTRRHAQKMIEIYQREGRLPATYPVPIQSWRFGDQLQMFFLGGEVVVDYALRLKKELKNPLLWVSSYSNDVLGYIASERMRSEGGYEYDRSGVFYGLPGPWSAGTEDLLIGNVIDLLKRKGADGPKSALDSLKHLKVADGFEIQLVAAEPLVQDPINIAFGADGKLWVVEMGDYPLGQKGADAHGGQIKFLEDVDSDGIFDKATLFLDKLSFPTGVFPWKDGVLISAAPDILFARDVNGDGRADEQTVLYSGFPLANPQHRINGFTYALDNSLHLASGDNLGEIHSVKTGEKINASGRDVQIWPDSGKLAATSGRTQYVRSRNDWGDWFGNDNSRPMFHYPIEDSYLRRNSNVRYSGNNKPLFSPASAPPVFPTSRTVERFNDLNTANRFTSACSAIVFRSAALGPEASNSIFVCEPVHNLVHRSVLVREGASFRAQRLGSEQKSEFLSSTDPWFRPVRVATGTDGMLWIVDMYRQVIEHPEWIPTAWQQQFDLRAGENIGRIYRVVPKGHPKVALPKLDRKSSAELVLSLNDPTGPVRDLAQQLILESSDPATLTFLSMNLAAITLPQGRIQALWILAVTNRLPADEVRSALKDEHSGVLGEAIRIAEAYFPNDERILTEFERLSQHPDQSIRLRVALASGSSINPHANSILAKMMGQDISDPWLRRSLISSSSKYALSMLQALLASLPNRTINEMPYSMEMVHQLIETAGAEQRETQTVLAEMLRQTDASKPWAMPLISELATIDKVLGDQNSSMRASIAQYYQSAIDQIKSTPSQENTASRTLALQLLGRGLGNAKLESSLLLGLLVPNEALEIQSTALDRLAAMRDAADVNLILSKWPTTSQAVRERFEQLCLSVPQWSQQLLTKMEQGSLNPRDMSPAFRQQMRAIGNRSFKSRTDRVLGTISAGSRKQIVEQYLNAEVSTGDAARGEPFFAKNCATCHSGKPDSLPIGPLLSNLSNRSLRAMAESILDPNLSVDPQYRSYTVLLKSGLTASGVIAEEIGDSLTIAHHDGKRTVIRRDDIESMTDTGKSLMPEGIEQLLDPQSFRDLVAFVQHSRP